MECVSLLVIITFLLGLAWFFYDHNEGVADETKPPLCIKSGEHECMCEDVPHPIIIEGDDSVKILNKTFDPEEIDLLKTLRDG